MFLFSVFRCLLGKICEEFFFLAPVNCIRVFLCISSSFIILDLMLYSPRPIFEPDFSLFYPHDFLFYYSIYYCSKPAPSYLFLVLFVFRTWLLTFRNELSSYRNFATRKLTTLLASTSMGWQTYMSD